MSATAVAFELAGADDRPIRGDALVAESATAAVVLCHGFKGFARWGFFPYLAGKLAAAGLTVVSFDFSTSGVGADRETFTEPDAFAANTFGKQVADVRTVWREGEKRGWLAVPTGLFGFSRGGGIVVLYTASESHVRALVTWSAIATVDRWPPHVRQEWRARGYVDVTNARTHQTLRVGTDFLDEIEQKAETELNILDAAARVRVPWLIVHGVADETVPVHESRQLHTASHDRAEMMLVERASHTYGFKHGAAEVSADLAAATDRTVRFFQSNLVG